MQIVICISQGLNYKYKPHWGTSHRSPGIRWANTHGLIAIPHMLKSPRSWSISNENGFLTFWRKEEKKTLRASGTPIENQRISLVFRPIFPLGHFYRSCCRIAVLFIPLIRLLCRWYRFFLPVMNNIYGFGIIMSCGCWAFCSIKTAFTGQSCRQIRCFY